MSVVLGKTGNRDVKVQFTNNYVSYHVHLSLSTIGDDEVGKWRFFLYHAAISASYHLFHGGVIIRTNYRLDIVFAIILAGWFHSFIYNAASHGVSPRNIGVIKAFYLIWKLWKL